MPAESRLCRWVLQNYSVSYVAATPTMFQSCLAAGKAMRFSKGLLAISTVESVGGPLPATLAVELAQWFSATVLQVCELPHQVLKYRGVRKVSRVRIRIYRFTAQADTATRPQ